MRLFYLPIAQYKERYSEYLSCIGGMFERAAKKFANAHKDFEWEAIRPYTSVHSLKSGVVLDPVVLCMYGFLQTEWTLRMIMCGDIREGDAIYCEDFWQPGMEMIPYALSLMGLMGKVKLYGFCHAQSLDKNDFTAKLMMPWISKFEWAWSECMATVFAASTENYYLAQGADSPFENILATGTNFDSEYLISKYYTPHNCSVEPRKKKVVYSSRLDEEKDPYLFFEIVNAVKQKRPDIEFVVCTGSEEFRSNDVAVLSMLGFLKDTSMITPLKRLSKQAYFKELQDAAVQINTGNQDFVSYTLLEATTFGCCPFYPRENNSFVEAIGDSKHLLYSKKESIDAIRDKLIDLVDFNSERLTFIENEPKHFQFVYAKYDESVGRMLEWIHSGKDGGGMSGSLMQGIVETQKAAAKFDVIYEQWLLVESKLNVT
jgi:glycosyltransferase involved in cell wall biosynthesis